MLNFPIGSFFSSYRLTRHETEQLRQNASQMVAVPLNRSTARLILTQATTCKPSSAQNHHCFDWVGVTEYGRLPIIESLMESSL